MLSCGTCLIWNIKVRNSLSTDPMLNLCKSYRNDDSWNITEENYQNKSVQCILSTWYLSHKFYNPLGKGSKFYEISPTKNHQDNQDNSLYQLETNNKMPRTMYKYFDQCNEGNVTSKASKAYSGYCQSNIQDSLHSILL